MKCYQNCNSNSCCVRQLDRRLNQSVKSHFPQCCTCFLYLLPFHENHGINSTEGCFPVVHSWLCWSHGRSNLFIWTVSAACTVQLSFQMLSKVPKSGRNKSSGLNLCTCVCFPTCKIQVGVCCLVHCYTLHSCKAGHFGICFCRCWKSSLEGRSLIF